jgi:hypothetical protein
MSNNHVIPDINGSDDLRSLTQQLSKATIEDSVSVHHSQGVYIPPGTSDDDELLILAGFDPYQWDTTSTTTTAETKLLEMQAAIRDTYGHYLQYEDDELTDATLPEDKEEIKALGHIMSNALLMRHQLGIKKLVFSPIKHPDFPCWLPAHRVNEVLRQAHSAMIANTYPEAKDTRQKDSDAMETS